MKMKFGQKKRATRAWTLWQATFEFTGSVDISFCFAFCFRPGPAERENLRDFGTYQTLIRKFLSGEKGSEGGETLGGKKCFQKSRTDPLGFFGFSVIQLETLSLPISHTAPAPPIATLLPNPVAAKTSTHTFHVFPAQNTRKFKGV
jgi:hypothetical protein